MIQEFNDLVNIDRYPCESLKPLEALFIWYLAEQSFIESQTTKRPINEIGPAESRLFAALSSLDYLAYHDFVALMWVGRDGGPYDEVRQNASGEIDPIYCTDKNLVLHDYIRTALESFGIKALHDINEQCYPARDQQAE